jgi:predicted O-methyltransferase YrrM
MFKFEYKDWTKVHLEIWEDLLFKHGLFEEKDKIIVEVGCFEGRSTIWFNENLMNTENSKYYCIDNWQGGEEVNRLALPFDMKLVYENFCHNISQLKSRNQITYYVDNSEKILSQLSGSLFRQADFIYLDGSHTQRDTLVDLILCLTLLKKGGIILVDDYTNNMKTKNELLRPQAAVDFIVKSFGNEISFKETRESQAVLQRIK